jgi:cytochrome c oxidase subunit II
MSSEEGHVPERNRGSRVARLAAPAGLLVLAGCDPRDSMLDAVAPQAGDIASLWWFIFWLGLAVYVVVMALLAVPLWRAVRQRRAAAPSSQREGEPPADVPTAASPASPRDAERQDHQPHDHTGRLAAPPAAIEDEPLATAPDADPPDVTADRRMRSRLIWWGGIILPAIILFILLIAANLTSRSVAHVPEDEDLVIDVIGHMFWWEAHYPDHDVTTANEIHVPTDTRVRLQLHTEDVIHSFWIPRVHGKIDMIPGQVNNLVFEVEEPGRYRGHCAEYCGIAHAQMVKFLVAQEPDEFEAWVEQQAAPADEPDTEATAEGQRMFFQYGCADCHAVSGHGAVGQVGPDLTHLASRESLASGIVPNDREHLAELILDPWGIKAGNPMPPTAIPDEDLEPLLDYLEGLE